MASNTKPLYAATQSGRIMAIGRLLPMQRQVEAANRGQAIPAWTVCPTSPAVANSLRRGN